MGKPASREESSWFTQLLHSPIFQLFLGTLLIAFGVFVLPQATQIFADAQGENVVVAWEMTQRFFSSAKFGPWSVLLSPELIALAQQQGISLDDLRAIIAAAANEAEPEKRFRWPRLAADLLGQSKIESGYCTNIGAGIAYYEILANIPGSFGKKNIKALEDLADELGADVLSIPGSIGGGAISCFQLLPYNWQRYGGGDYRKAFDAGMKAARFLKDYGYDGSPDGFETALARYNPSGEQAYIDAVVEAVSIWDGKVDSAVVMEPVPVNWITITTIYTEYLAWLMSGGVDIPVAGEFTNPYPGSSVCGNGFAEVISPTYVHWGTDRCLPGLISGEVVAAHNGTVVFQGPVSRSDSRAWDATIDDYLSASGYLVVLEAIGEDGKWIQTIYAHLDPNDLPGVGTTLGMGEHLGTAMCSGDPKLEYCSNSSGHPDHHLHWGFKREGDPIDGGFGVNPEDLID